MHTFEHFEALHDAFLLLTLSTFGLLMKIVNQLIEVDFFEHFLNSASTHFNGDEIFIFLVEVTVIYFVDDGTFYEAGQESLLLAIIIFKFFEFLGLSFGESLNVSTFGFRFVFIANLNSLTSNIGLRFEVFETLFDFFFIGINNEIRSKVYNFLNILNGNIEQEAKCGWGTAHEPDVCNWCS